MQVANQSERPHTGWLEMLKPFIAAYKAGVDTVLDFVSEEKLVYWYRTTEKGIICDVTDTAMRNDSASFFRGRPYGWESMTDEVQYSLLRSSNPRPKCWSSRETRHKQSRSLRVSAHTQYPWA